MCVHYIVICVMPKDYHNIHNILVPQFMWFGVRLMSIFGHDPQSFINGHPHINLSFPSIYTFLPISDKSLLFYPFFSNYLIRTRVVFMLLLKPFSFANEHKALCSYCCPFFYASFYTHNALHRIFILIYFVSFLSENLFEVTFTSLEIVYELRHFRC